MTKGPHYLNASVCVHVCDSVRACGRRSPSRRALVVNCQLIFGLTVLDELSGGKEDCTPAQTITRRISLYYLGLEIFFFLSCVHIHNT